MAPFLMVILLWKAETFFRENYLKSRTLVFLGLNFQMCLMLHQHMFNNCQSQTGTTSPAAAV